MRIDVHLLQEFEKAPDMQTYMSNLVPKLKLMHEMRQQNLQDKNVVAKKYYDKGYEVTDLQIGDQVLLHGPNTKVGECFKLKKRWTGPFLVVDKSQDGLSYKLRHCDTGRELRSYIHVNRLKRYNDNRDAFYNKHHTVPKPSGNLTQSQSQSYGTAAWYPIKQILNRGVRDKKEMF